MSEIELKTIPAVIYIPANAVSMKMICKLVIGDTLQEVETELSVNDLRKCINDAEQNYISDDTIFMLTEKGEEEAKNILKDNT